MPSGRHRRRGLAAALAVTVVAAVSALTLTTALAVSGGGYSPSRQGCSATADRNDRAAAQPSCHNATLQVGSGRWTPVAVNTDQSANGDVVNSGSVVVDGGQGTKGSVRFTTGQPGVVTSAQNLGAWLAAGGSGAPPSPTGIGGTPTVTLVQAHSRTSGFSADHPTASVYLGADDNLDFGEHDGVDPSAHNGRDRVAANGPSDGGALQVNVHPQGSLKQPATLTKNVSPGSLQDPLRAADAGAGACADGICAGADSAHRKLYQGGCRTCHDQAVYDDQQTTKWRSPDCNSGSTAAQGDCGAQWASGSENGSIAGPYYERGAYYSDPGVFVYEDPDPQSSPATPFYPVCEVYVGTEGVYACSNAVASPQHGVNPGGAEAAAASLAASVQSAVAGIAAGGPIGAPGTPLHP